MSVVLCGTLRRSVELVQTLPGTAGCTDGAKTLHYSACASGVDDSKTVIVTYDWLHSLGFARLCSPSASFVETAEMPEIECRLT
eukprot:2429318-Amphidinium_carterae.2